MTEITRRHSDGDSRGIKFDGTHGRARNHDLIQTVMLQRSVMAKPTEKKANTKKSETPSHQGKESNDPNLSDDEGTEAK